MVKKAQQAQAEQQEANEPPKDPEIVEVPGDGIEKKGIEAEAGKAYELSTDGSVRELTPEETAALLAQGDVELAPTEAETAEAAALLANGEPIFEAPPKDPLTEALAAMPWERTDEQRRLILTADADVRLESMVEDQRKLRERPL